MSIYSYSVVDIENAGTPPDGFPARGMSSSDWNNTFRKIMGDIARQREDLTNALTSSVSGVDAFSSRYDLTLLDARGVEPIPNGFLALLRTSSFSTNTAPVYLSVDGVVYRPLTYHDGSAVPAGSLGGGDAIIVFNVDRWQLLSPIRQSAARQIRSVSVTTTTTETLRSSDVFNTLAFDNDNPASVTTLNIDLPQVVVDAWPIGADIEILQQGWRGGDISLSVPGGVSVGNTSQNPDGTLQTPLGFLVSTCTQSRLIRLSATEFDIIQNLSAVR